MGERDAFGREKGENTLAEMGWSTSPSSSGPSSRETPPVERPATPDQPRVTVSTSSAMDAGEAASVADAFRSARTAQPQAVAVRRRRSGRMSIPIVLVVILAIAGFGISAAINAGTDALDDFNSAIREAVPEPAGNDPGSAPPAADDQGDDAGSGGSKASGGSKSSGASLLRSSALRSALRKLPKGDLVMLRLTPDQLSAQVRDGETLHVVTVSRDGAVQDIETSANLPDLGGLKVNTAAPNRLARAAARKAKRKVSDIDYMVLISIPTGPTAWQLFFKDGTHYSSDENGRNVRKAS
jgi:hypothetical protein